MGDSTTVDIETDMQTIRDYVDAVVQAQAQFTTAYGAALDCFQFTVQTASPKEATPDILGVVAKSGLKFAEKAAVTAVKDSTGADLGPMVEMVHAIYDETERAAKAATARSAADFVTGLRTAIINGYTQGTGRQAMVEQLQKEYNQNDEGGRGGYIAGIENELAATKSVHAPKVEAIEQALYEGWINQNFNQDCMDGTGIIYVQYDSDGTLSSATITAPLGDKVAARLNKIMGPAGANSLMNIDVVKKVCRDATCMCFEGNNVVRKDTDDDDAHAFLASSDQWKGLKQFTTN
jgi:hypothetical protein